MKQIFMTIAAVSIALPLNATLKSSVQHDLATALANVGMINAHVKTLQDFDAVGLVCGKKKDKNAKEKLNPAYTTLLSDINETADMILIQLSSLIKALQNINYCVPNETVKDAINNIWSSASSELMKLMADTKALHTKKINGKTVDRCSKGEVQKDSKEMIADMAAKATEAANQLQQAMMTLKNGEGKPWCVK